MFKYIISFSTNINTKPIVKYRQSTFTFCGERQTHRYKHTLLATITGPEARALLANKERGGDLYWHPVSNDKLEIYEDMLLLLPDTKKLRNNLNLTEGG